MENIKALVRPIMAYSFMCLFFAVDIPTFITLVDAGTGAEDALQKNWDDSVMALWAIILGFYFGGRQCVKN